MGSTGKRNFTFAQVLSIVSNESTKIWQGLVTISDIIITPFEIAYCAFFIYIYVGWSILSGLALWLIRFVIMRYIGHDKMEFQQKMNELKDTRLQKTTESFMNIKMLKLQGWETRFQEQITKDYENEQLLNETQLIPDALRSMTNTLFNALLGIVICATYVYSGNVMSVSTTVLAQVMISKIVGPINRISNFYETMLDVQVSLGRVHQYLTTNETQPNVVLKASKLEEKMENINDIKAPIAVSIKGNYSFGFGQSDNDEVKKVSDGKNQETITSGDLQK